MKRKITYPYLFVDTDRNSATFGQWCIRWSDSYSEDGFATKLEAVNAMNEERKCA